MNDSYSTIRAIRGPVTLITIGVLFALNNFTQYGFDRTWPVILIVFGLLSLLRRGMQPTGPAGAPNMPPPPPYSYAPPGGYSQSSYAGGPAGTPGAPAGTAKGGFGSSAPPRSGGPATTPGDAGAPPGGSV
jgi:Domain of unknown function (DUF5668)